MTEGREGCKGSDFGDLGSAQDFVRNLGGLVHSIGGGHDGDVAETGNREQRRG
jgi:hypothetical protein